MQRAAAVQVCLAWALAMVVAPALASEPGREWNALVDGYLEEVYFPQNPSYATVSGIHRYDREMEAYSAQEIAAENRVLHEYERRVANFPTAGLGQVDAADREILLGHIRSELLTSETLRPQEKNPDIYSSGATGSVYVLMERKFAPAEVRLRSVIAREKKIPGVLAEARKNLKNPAKIYTQIAIEQIPGIIGFFAKDVPEAFAEVKDPALTAEFAKSNGETIAALKAYGEWLEKDLLPRADGDFRIGAENYSKKLKYEDMVDTPLDRLLEVGLDDLHQNQAELRRVAKEVDATSSVQEVMARLGKMHPAPERLMTMFGGTFDSLIAFIQEKKIITIPQGPKPILMETPPFERATTTASMDTPGPFESKATESYFRVTLPGPKDSNEEIESLMSAFNIGTIFSTSVHETYPGHYLQYLWTSRAPSKLRKVIFANTNGEGWAHYCEQMMFEEGYVRPGRGAKDEQEVKLVHLGQLQDALLRDARFVVGIQMHTGKMNFEEAKKFFVEEGLQSERIAEIEAKRGTSDPTYLYYTLGKLQILKLREDYKKKMGASYTLGEFHDKFMAQGFPPIAVVRQALLGDGSPVL